MHAFSAPSAPTDNRSNKRVPWAVLSALALGVPASPVAASVSTGTLGVSLTIQAAGCVFTGGLTPQSFGLGTEPSRMLVRAPACELPGSFPRQAAAPTSVTKGVQDISLGTSASPGTPTVDPLVPEPAEIVTITY